MAEAKIKTQMPLSVNAKMKGKDVREQLNRINAVRTRAMVGKAQLKANRPKPRVAG